MLEEAKNTGECRTLESRLGQLMGTLLHMAPDTIDPLTSFLELGADSLVLVDAIGTIEREFGVKLSIRQLFEELPHIRAVSGYLKQKMHQSEAESAPEAVVVETQSPTSAVVAAEPQLVSQVSAPVTTGKSVEWVMSQQLQTMKQLMSAQLAALGGLTTPIDTLEATQTTAVRLGPKVAAKSKGGSPFSAPEERNARKLSQSQQQHLNDLVASYTHRTKGSRRVAETTHKRWADMRSSFLFRLESKEIAYPIIGAQSKGPYFWDVDGNQYVDVAMGFGVNYFGHNPEFIRKALAERLEQGIQVGPESHLAGECAQLIHELTGVDRVTFCNSGTEAVMTAIRIARAATGKSRIVMFSGAYHGHSDNTLVVGQKAGDSYQSMPMTLGVPQAVADEVLVLPYDSPESLRIIRENIHELAAVLVEPVQSRQPHIQPKAFLKDLRALTSEAGAALIFDEVLLGFRIHPGGAQHWCDVRADLVTYGKVVGGGMPLGVISGTPRLMDLVDGGVWQFGDDSQPLKATTFVAGTFSKHPMAMTSTKAVLKRMKQEGPALQENLNRKTARLAETVNAMAEANHFPIRVAHFGSLFRITLAGNHTYLYQPLEIDLFFYHLIHRGVYTWEGRTCYLSTAHTDADISHIIWAIQDTLASMRKGGFWLAPQGWNKPVAVPSEKNLLPGRKLPSLDQQPFQPQPLHQSTAAKAGSSPDFRAGADYRPDTYSSMPPMVYDVPTMARVASQDKGVQFSMFFFGNYESEFRENKYNLLFEASRYADDHGFTGLWFPERHFHQFGGFSPNPSVIAAAVANATRNIQLRAGSVVLPLHHPVRVVEEWSVVDNISQGRVGLSFASGWHPNDFIFAPQNFDQCREVMFENLTQVRDAWRGKPISGLGGTGKPVELTLFPMPRQKELPVWLTIVRNPDMYVKAGELGAGILTNLMGQTVDELRANIALYRESLAKNGFDPKSGHVTILLHTFITDDMQHARDIAREPFRQYLLSSMGLFKGLLKVQNGDMDLDRMSQEDLEYIAGAAFDRYVKDSALIGSVESCSAVLENLIDAGMDEAACFLDFGVDPDVVLAHLPKINHLRLCLQKTESTFEERADVAVSAPLEMPIVEPQAYGQQALWYMYQLDSTSPAYNQMYAAHVADDTDVAILERALNLLNDRYEILRTTYASGEECQVQVIHPECNSRVHYHDGASWSGDAFQNWFDEEADRPFDLEKGPVTRISLVKNLVCLEKAPTRTLMVFCVHHIAADLWSFEQLIVELSAIYRALRNQESIDLAPPQKQFRQFAAEEREMLTGPKGEALLTYWLEKLSGEVPRLELPLDHPRPPLQTFHGDKAHFQFDAETSKQIRKLARDHKTTPYVVFLTALQVLLARYSNGGRVITGTPMAGQNLPGGSEVLGHLANPVLLVTDFQDNPVLPVLLARIQRNVLEAMEHQGYPFPLLVEHIQPERDPSRSPLFQVQFDWDQPRRRDSGEALLRRDGLIEKTFDLGQRGADFDLTLTVVENGGPFACHLTYNVDLFEPETAARITGHLETLLQGFLADADRPVFEFELLSSAEQREQISSNETFQPAPQVKGVHDWFAQQARDNPQAPALVFYESPEIQTASLSYGELNRRANQLAHHLVERGITTETPVGIYCRRSPELVIAILAVLKAGASYVPMDPEFPGDRLAHICRDSGVRLLITQTEIPQGQPFDGLEILALNGAAAEVLQKASDDNPDVPWDPDRRAYAIYTSGSTGKPKGVEISHGALLNFIGSMMRHPGLEPNDTLVAVTTISFDISGLEIFLPLCTGARLVMADEAVSANPADLAALLKRVNATVLQATPITWQLLIESGWQGAKGLRVLCGGEALPHDLAEAVAAKTAAVFNMYGPTETTIWSSVKHFQPVAYGEATPLVSLGPPIDNTQFYVVDSQLRPVPMGLGGELLIGGSGLARGYTRRPGLTATKFVPNPFRGEDGLEGTRLYRTGDLVRRLPNNELEFLGRMDHQIKLRGVRIELGEIEAALVGAENVAQALVVKRRDGGNERLVAYLTASGATQPQPDQMRTALSQSLPEYMIPAAFVILDKFPLTPNGKVDRGALPAPDYKAIASAGEFVAAGNQTEKVIAEIWQEVLQLEAVGVFDNFFDLGGNSLLLLRVQKLLRDKLPCPPDVVTMLTYPSIRALSAYLEGDSRHTNLEAARDRQQKKRARRRATHRRNAAEPTAIEFATEGV